MNTRSLIMFALTAMIAWLSAPDAIATYDTVQGRWLERDPAGYVDGMNPYSYVRGHPTNSVDPSGAILCFAGAMSNQLVYMMNESLDNAVELAATCNCKAQPGYSEVVGEDLPAGWGNVFTQVVQEIRTDPLELYIEIVGLDGSFLFGQPIKSQIDYGDIAAIPVDGAQQGVLDRAAVIAHELHEFYQNQIKGLPLRPDAHIKGLSKENLILQERGATAFRYAPSIPKEVGATTLMEPLWDWGLTGPVHWLVISGPTTWKNPTSFQTAPYP